LEDLIVKQIEDKFLEEDTLEEGILFQEVEEEAEEEKSSVMLVGKQGTCLGNVLKIRMQELEKLMFMRRSRGMWR
jgi:hypothetical protein